MRCSGVRAWWRLWRLVGRRIRVWWLLARRAPTFRNSVHNRYCAGRSSRGCQSPRTPERTERGAAKQLADQWNADQRSHRRKRDHAGSAFCGKRRRPQLVLRNAVVPARRPLVFLAVDLLVAFCGSAFFGAGSDGTGLRVAFAGASGFRFTLRSNNAPPPTASSTGHSTRPATPSAPMANAAAGVEWLPLLTPRLMPSAAPVTPPTIPFTAAPPTAPAAAVAASAARPTVLPTLRTAPPTTPMMTPWYLIALTGNRAANVYPRRTQS